MEACSPGVIRPASGERRAYWHAMMQMATATCLARATCDCEWFWQNDIHRAEAPEFDKSTSISLAK